MIELNWTLLVQMVNFLVLMVVLDKLLYKPILKVLDERDARIAGGQEETKELLEKGDAIFADYTDKIHEAKVDALSVKNAARKEATSQGNGIVDESRKEAEKIIAQIQQEMAVEIDKAKKELEPELQSMAADIAEQILGRKVA